jgi:hypothetical protein
MIKERTKVGDSKNLLQKLFNEPPHQRVVRNCVLETETLRAIT